MASPCCGSCGRRNSDAGELRRLGRLDAWLVGEGALDVPGAVAGFGLFYLGFDELEECGHRGRDPLVLMPEDVGADVERGAAPVESLELILAELAGDYDRGQQSQAHAGADALLDGFDT